MSTVKNLSFGSTGDEVKQLQTALGFTGSDVDGIFGKKTQQAVIDYQKANGLTVDGIAGKNTQGKLYSNTGAQAAGSNAGAAGNNAGAAGNNAAPAATTQDTFTYPDYTINQLEKSDTLKQAETILQEYEATRPGEWVDPYRDKYMGYLEQYENRDPFSYDFNSDALYQQYKDQYIQQGQMAMMDTMGQAAAMTGGYGNSYAQTVGQQAYNQQLGQLNEIMPELYQMAYERYGQEGQELLDMFNMYLGLSEQDYGRHQDSLDNWYQEMARLTDNVNTMYGREWDQYVLNEDTRLNLYNTGRSEAFADHQTAQSQAFTSSENDKDRQWKTEEADKDRIAKDKETNYNKLANLIQSAGYEPSAAELEAAGMTSAEAKALKDAYTASQTKTPEYTVLDYEEQAKWSKEFDRAKTLQDVEWVADRMEAAGVDPQIVASWYNTYANKFRDEQPPAKIPTGGGGGGGVWYMEKE